MADNSKAEVKGKGLDTIDKPVLAISGIICIVIIALTLGFKDAAATLISDMNSAIIANFAWFYNLVWWVAWCLFIMLHFRVMAR